LAECDYNVVKGRARKTYRAAQLLLLPPPRVYPMVREFINKAVPTRGMTSDERRLIIRKTTTAAAARPPIHPPAGRSDCINNNMYAAVLYHILYSSVRQTANSEGEMISRAGSRVLVGIVGTSSAIVLREIYKKSVLRFLSNIILFVTT